MNKWTHFAHASGPDCEEYFIDGKSAVRTAPGGDFTVSFWYRDANHFRDIAIWNSALSEKEMKKMADWSTAVLNQPLVPTPSLSDVTIRQVENGFLVIVGCKSFVFATYLEASKAVGEYFKNPEAAQKKYCRK